MRRVYAREAGPAIAGRPRRKASPLIGRPPAGWTLVESQRAIHGHERRPAIGRDDRPGRIGGTRGLGRQDGRGQDDDPFTADLEERPGPRQIGPDLALELDGRDRRVEAAVRPSKRPGQRRAVLRLGVAAQLAGQPRSERSGARRPAARSARRASRSGAVSSPASPIRSVATIGPVSRPASIRIRLTPVTPVGGEDRRRDRGGPAVAGQERRVQVEGTEGTGRGARRARSGRSRRGRRARAPAAETVGERCRSREASRGLDVEAERGGRLVDRRPRLAPAAAGRSWRGRDDGHEVKAGVCDERAAGSAGRRRRCRGRPFGPARCRAVRPHRQAPPRASREDLRGLPRVARMLGVSASSSSSSDPTGISSSIDFEVVDEQLAVEVVELVLERPAEQPGPGDLDLLAVPVLGHDPDLLAPRDVGVVARQRQAALEVAVVAGWPARSAGSSARRACPGPR